MKSLLRFSLITCVAMLMVSTTFAQDKSKRASPPMTAKATIGSANVAVTFSSPSAKGRAIWGKLVPYGKIWRAGANEATTFETDKEVSVEGQVLPAGKYSLFLLPEDGKWTFVFNSISDQWGAYQYDEKKDVLRVEAKPVKAGSKSEKLNYEIVDGKLWLMWDDMQGGVSIK